VETPAECSLADAKAGNRYWNGFEQGYWSLARQLYPVFMEHEVADGWSLVEFEETCLEIFASLPREILSGLLGAGLHRRIAGDRNLEATLADNWKRSKRRPCIYVFELVDSHGLPPTVKELKKILEDVCRALRSTNVEQQPLITLHSGRDLRKREGR